MLQKYQKEKKRSRNGCRCRLLPFCNQSKGQRWRPIKRKRRFCSAQEHKGHWGRRQAVWQRWNKAINKKRKQREAELAGRKSSSSAAGWGLRLFHPSFQDLLSSGGISMDRLGSSKSVGFWKMRIPDDGHFECRRCHDNGGTAEGAIGIVMQMRRPCSLPAPSPCPPSSSLWPPFWICPTNGRVATLIRSFNSISAPSHLLFSCYIQSVTLTPSNFSFIWIFRWD